MGWKIKSTWYRPSTGYRLRTPKELEALRLEFYDWYQKTHGRGYKAVTAPNETVRKTILAESKIVNRCEIRPITQAHAFPYAIDAKGKEFKAIGVTAPALYVVIYKGKRVDAFLNANRAKECAMSLNFPAGKEGTF